MKRFLLVVFGLVLVSAVIYLVSTNNTPTDFQLTPSIVLSYSLGALMVASFLCGAVTVLTAVMLQAGGRALLAWRHLRRERNSQRTHEMEEKGEQLMWQGDAKHGRALLEKAYRREPSNSYAVLALAASYRATGETVRERQFLADAVDHHHHTNPDVLLALAQAHAYAGERAQAIEVLERLRALHPRAPRVLLALRDAYRDAGRWYDAIAPQEALIVESRDPQQAVRERDVLTTMRYQASLAIEDPKARIDALEALAERRSLAAPVAVSLGDALAEAGRSDDAIGVWERALRTTPQSVLVERLAKAARDKSGRSRLIGVLRRLRPEAVDMDKVRLFVAEQLLVDDLVTDAAQELMAVEDPAGAGAFYLKIQGEIHRRRGELQQAVDALAQVDAHPRRYHCTTCGRANPTWLGVCPCCKSWNQHRAETEIARD